MSGLIATAALLKANENNLERLAGSNLQESPHREGIIVRRADRKSSFFTFSTSKIRRGILSLNGKHLLALNEVAIFIGYL